MSRPEDSRSTAASAPSRVRFGSGFRSAAVRERWERLLTTQRLRMPLLAGTLLALVSGPAGACVSISGDRILAKDLAAANRYFAPLDSAIEIGFAPRPGASRLMRFAELQALARRHTVGDLPLPDAASGNGDVCFVRVASGGGASRKEAAAFEVRRGDSVGVDVQIGAAHLMFIARAESEGRAGESVQVRNPATGHVFPATVAAKGKVVVRR